MTIKASNQTQTKRAYQAPTLEQSSQAWPSLVQLSASIGPTRSFGAPIKD